jgi:hypothetical protein
MGTGRRSARPTNASKVTAEARASEQRSSILDAATAVYSTRATANEVTAPRICARRGQTSVMSHVAPRLVLLAVLGSVCRFIPA